MRRIGGRSTPGLAALALALLSGPQAGARTWRVSPDGHGDAPTIQAAIDSTQPGDVVLLAPGTYTWTAQGPARASMLHLAPGIALRGEAGAAATILDGEAMGRLLVAVDVGGDVVLEDLTFQNGLAPPEHAPDPGPRLGGRAPAVATAPDDSHGGAIDVRGDSHATIRRCHFRFNRAMGGRARGGAVACLTATIEDCTFESNEAGVSGPTNGSGGAVWCTGATLRRSIFRGNVAWGHEAASGGAVHSESATISDCTFEDNRARCPGAPHGGAVLDNGYGLLERCIFRGNVADANYTACTGGAADFGSGTVQDCQFWGNAATCRRGPGQGGALAGTELTVRRCIFAGNTAMRTDVPGAGRGGAVFVRFASTIESCTLVGNSGGSADGTGGIHFEEGGTVRATIVAATTVGRVCAGAATWSCCVLYGNAAGDAVCGVDGGGNRSVDPLFCAADPAASGDVSVRSDSPCAPGPGGCGGIGAAGVGCLASPVELGTWTEVKRRYRD